MHDLSLFKKHKIITVALLIVIALGLIPLYMPGITSGDDLQRRFMGGYMGYGNYVKW